MLAVAQNASAQATVFEAELKDQLEVAKETVSHKVAEVSQMAHSMAQFLTDAEVEQLLGEFSMDTCWDQAVEAENLAQAKVYSTRLSIWQANWKLHQPNWWTWIRDKQWPLIFISRRKRC